MRPTNDISIEFEIRPNFVVLWFKMHSTDDNEILHTSRQYNCRDVCKILLWSVMYILKKSAPNFDLISNSIEISLVGWPPGAMQYTSFEVFCFHHKWTILDIMIFTGMNNLS